MDRSTFRVVFLAQSLSRQDDGSYLVQNRRYQPVGTTARRSDPVPPSWPVRVRFPELDADMAAKLSFSGSTDLEMVYLYDDTADHLPVPGTEQWTAYAARLELLSGMRVVWD